MNALRRTRILLACSAVLLFTSMWLPLWRVSLHAPQYPEGLGMRIWAGTVNGVEPNDLQNINGLNHYIGMKTIQPDAIPELKLMPWGIAAMSLLGIALAARGKRKSMMAWAIVLMVSAFVGLGDFWKWEYDYGHNLDLEHAPIQIPGMAYQPPLFGTKQLLNFTATSLPDIGGWLAITAVAFAVAVIVTGRRTRVAAAIVVAASLAACQDGPRQILTGADTCGYCRMAIDDARFAGEVKTSHGKIEVFDSIECLASFVIALPASEKPLGVWVSDADRPNHWVSAESARYLRDGSLHSPMGRRLAAFDSAYVPALLQQKYGGELLNWNSVKQMMDSLVGTH
ncbi:MAG: nitrous oxide reductase accessory protein NosL [Gemmatimonadaceae bacterium]